MRLNFAFALSLILPSVARCQQDSTHRSPSLSISGSADVYYRYDLSRTAANDYTSFTHSQNQFNLGMAGIRLEHSTAKVDMVADLAAGQRQREYASTDKGIVQAIEQLYISYTPIEWLKLTAGTWATHLCYESPDATADRNYSMSYLFSNDPFSHTGVKAEITAGKNGFMIGVANPCNYRSIPDSAHNNKNLIAQYTYTPTDKIKLLFNYFGGRDINDNRLHQYDLVLTAKTNSIFSLGFNGTVNRSSLATEKYSIARSWWGAALYLNLDPKKWLGFTLRTEYFNDSQGVCLPTPSTVVANTLSANFKVDGLTFIPEFRVDQAGNPIFVHANGSPARTAASFLLAAVYSF